MGTRKITIKRGLNLPIKGRPEQIVTDRKMPGKVALLGTDYQGMKPHLVVSEGDFVKSGELLFYDRKVPSVRYTSPGAGKVIEINRGNKRMLLSVVIQLTGDDEVTFNSFSEHELPFLRRESVTGLLLESGLWTSIRSRPFSRVANPEKVPHSLFITAIDTNPLAPSIPKIIEGREKHFLNGIKVLSKLTDRKVFLCKSPDDEIPLPDLDSVSVAEFSGKHPAGNAGTHIHFLDPVGRNREVWYVNAQDVIAVGKLFITGRLDLERIVSLAGPSVTKPRLIVTRLGSSLDDITKGELDSGIHRTISGSPLSGHMADVSTGYLGRFHQQVSVIPAGGKRKFLGWLRPGLGQYSVKNIVMPRLFSADGFRFDTSAYGDRRAIVPLGSYEKIMPLDIMPTLLLKALGSDDLDEAEKLGCLELDEEDLALCSFVCPSKINHGSELRRNLDMLEKEY